METRKGPKGPSRCQAAIDALNDACRSSAARHKERRVPRVLAKGSSGVLRVPLWVNEAQSQMRREAYDKHTRCVAMQRAAEGACGTQSSQDGAPCSAQCSARRAVKLTCGARKGYSRSGCATPQALEMEVEMRTTRAEALMSLKQYRKVLHRRRLVPSVPLRTYLGALVGGTAAAGLPQSL
jgi:hypothetical protein